MEKFEKYKIENTELIFGGELYPTYIGQNGDFYDSERKRFTGK